MGVDTLPPLPKDAGDRNRTSPFRLHRQSSSSTAQSVRQAARSTGRLVALNTIVAESLDYCADKLEAAVKAGTPLNTAIQTLLAGVMAESEAIIFNGDGYSAAWHAEAAKRGLLNLKTTVDALPELTKQPVKDLFAKYGVLSERELQSRSDIYFEQYIKTVKVEALLTVEMAKTLIFPAAIRYQNELASTCANLKMVGYEFDTNTLDKVTDLVKQLQEGIAGLEKALHHHDAEGLEAEAKHFCDDVIPAMKEVRAAADELEGWVSDDLWPLPTYQEMLFIK